jgi:MYXO-CTERM domain-containing protein
MAPPRLSWHRSLLAVTTAVVVSTWASRGARACTCVDTTAVAASAADLLANHAAIFEGRVLGTQEPPDPPPDAGYKVRLAALEAKIELLKEGLSGHDVHFEVLRSWKGATGYVVVRTRGQRTACGYPFEVGHTYMVFADRGEDGSLWVSSCGRTRPSQESEADRALLDAPAAAPPPASTAPPRAGCAGCAAAPDPGPGGVVGLALAFLAAMRGRRRQRC